MLSAAEATVTAPAGGGTLRRRLQATLVTNKGDNVFSLARSGKKPHSSVLDPATESMRASTSTVPPGAHGHG